MTVRVPAKINIVLSVGPQRPDGFHDLATVFHAVSLYDEVAASDTDDDGGGASGGQEPDPVTVEITGPYGAGVPVDESNLAARAAHALAEAAGVPARASLKIRKRIPVAAGLAGGSADAAGALLACNELWGLGWSMVRLSRVAASLGSDVPFALAGGSALGLGRGERLQAQRLGGGLNWVLAIADGELSTPAVYRTLDEVRNDGPEVAPPAVEPDVLEALERGDAEALGPLLHNDMQPAALHLRPKLAATLHAGTQAGALGGIVCGSGPTCAFLARDRPHARAVSDALAGSGTCAAAKAVTGPVTPEH